MAFGEIGKLFVSIGADISEFQSGLNQVNKETKGWQGTVMKHSRAIGGGMLALGGSIAAVGIGSLKTAAEFEAGMREVNTMMNLSQDEFENLSKQVIQTAKDVGKAPAEMAEALYQVVSAGIPAGEALAFLETSAKAAIGGVTDTTTAVGGLTKVINAFGLNASDATNVADIMFTIVKGGITNMEKLSASMFQVAPIAAASGIAFEEVAAALATMTKQGVPTSVATTQLRQAIVQLNKPTTEMQKAIEGLGFASGETMLAELGFAETLQELTSTTEGSNETLIKMFGSIEAGQAVLSLTGKNAKVFKADLDAMARASDGAGASQAAYNEINEGAARKFEIMTNQIQGVAVQLGTALMPAIVSVVGAVTPLLTSLATWISDNPTLTKGLLAVGAALAAITIPLGTILIMSPKAGLALLKLGGSAMAASAGLIVKAVASIWSWAAAIPVAGIAIGLAATAAIVGSIFAIRSKMRSFEFGGVVPGPIGQPVPIIAHGGEKFLGSNPAKLPTMTPGGNVRDVHIHTLAFAGDRRGAKELWALLREAAREDQRAVFGSANF